MAIGPSSGSLLDFLCSVPLRPNVWFLNSRQCIAHGVDNFPTVGGYEDASFFFFFFSLFLALKRARGTPGGTEAFAVLGNQIGTFYVQSLLGTVSILCTESTCRDSFIPGSMRPRNAQVK